MPRIGAAVIAAPLFPPPLFPILLRSGVVVSLALFLYPHMSASTVLPLTPIAWIALLAKEMFIGTLLGVAVGMLAWAFESAGALSDFQVGFTNAALFDPFGGHDSGPFAALMLRIGILLFVVGGGLYVFAALLFESFSVWPVTSFYPLIDTRLADFAGASLQSLVQLGVRLALPVVLVLALLDIGFGLLNRVVSQLNVFYFTMSIKALLAALMLALYLSYLVDIAALQLAQLQTWVQRMLPVLSTH